MLRNKISSTSSFLSIRNSVSVISRSNVCHQQTANQNNNNNNNITTISRQPPQKPFPHFATSSPTSFFLKPTQRFLNNNNGNNPISLGEASHNLKMSGGDVEGNKNNNSSNEPDDAANLPPVPPKPPKTFAEFIEHCEIMSFIDETFHIGAFAQFQRFIAQGGGASSPSRLSPEASSTTSANKNYLASALPLLVAASVAAHHHRNQSCQSTAINFSYVASLFLCSSQIPERILQELQNGQELTNNSNNNNSKKHKMLLSSLRLAFSWLPEQTNIFSASTSSSGEVNVLEELNKRDDFRRISHLLLPFWQKKSMNYEGSDVSISSRFFANPATQIRSTRRILEFNFPNATKFEFDGDEFAPFQFNDDFLKTVFCGGNNNNNKNADAAGATIKEEIKFPRLERLSFVCCSRISDGAFEHLFSLTHSTLKELVFNHCQNITGVPSKHEKSSSSSSLESLEFVACMDDEVNLEGLVHFKNSLKSLTLVPMNDALIDKIMTQTIAKSSLNRLTHLEISGQGSPEEDENNLADEDVVEMLSKLPALENLNLSYNCNITGRGWGKIPFQNLKTLNLTNCPHFSDLKFLLKSSLSKTLEILLLGGTSVRDSSLENIVNLKSLKKLNLQTTKFASCRMSDGPVTPQITGENFFSGGYFRGLTQLEDVDFSGCSSLKKIEFLQHISASLTTLNLSECKNLQDQDIGQHVLACLPNLRNLNLCGSSENITGKNWEKYLSSPASSTTSAATKIQLLLLHRSRHMQHFEFLAHLDKNLQILGFDHCEAIRDENLKQIVDSEFGRNRLTSFEWDMSPNVTFDGLLKCLGPECKGLKAVELFAYRSLEKQKEIFMNEEKREKLLKQLSHVKWVDIRDDEKR